MISILDQQVGEIIDKVKVLGLEKNTIIIFTSDNGPHQEGGKDLDYFNSNGNLKGYKRDLYEVGIRVPMIVSWPGKTKPNKKAVHISAFWDVFQHLIILMVYHSCPPFKTIKKSKKNMTICIGNFMKKGLDKRCAKVTGKLLNTMY
jgi:membrane-anchored protein YejM (alkaline phosphatase superfamily)